MGSRHKQSRLKSPQAKIKQVLCAAMSIFLLWQTYSLVSKIEMFASLSLAGNILLAWLLSLFITGIFAFAGFGFPTERLLPERYYQLAYAKQLKRVYKALHVELFRKALLATIWRSKDSQKKYFDGTAAGLETLDTNTRKSEIGHLLPMVVTLAVGVYVCILGMVLLAVLLQVFNIVGNLYPVLLQRYHRLRIGVLKIRYGTAL